MDSYTKHSLALFSMVSFLVFGSVHAQPIDRRNGNGGTNNGTGQGRINQQVNDRVRSFPSAGQTTGSFDHQSRQSAYDPRRVIAPSSPNRVADNGSNNWDNRRQRTSDPQPNYSTANRQPSYSRNVTVYQNRTYVNNNYRGSASRSYYPQRVNTLRYFPVPRRYVYVGAPRYSVLPRGYLHLSFGGYPYYYYNGLFYSYYSGFYEPVYAPVGIHVSLIPRGYYPIYVGPTRYYYYEGTYYRQNSDSDYEVVDAPVGASVALLPKGAKSVTLNGEKFYEFNGTYYKEGVNEKNEVIYTIAGKYGNINNTDAAPFSQAPAALQMGSVVPALPDGAKEVVINGEHLFVSPDNTYFRAQANNGEISYKVVGLPYN